MQLHLIQLKMKQLLDVYNINAKYIILILYGFI